MEGEDRFFDCITLLVRFEFKVCHFFLTQHHLYGIVDIRFPIRFADEWHCSGSSWVSLNDVDLIIFDGKLDINQAYGSQSQGNFMGIGLDLTNYQITQIIWGQYRIRVSRVNSRRLDMLHDSDDINIPRSDPGGFHCSEYPEAHLPHAVRVPFH